MRLGLHLKTRRVVIIGLVDKERIVRIGHHPRVRRWQKRRHHVGWGGTEWV